MAKHFTAEQISQMRKKLLVASAELFLTKGYAATTLLLICKKSGIDKGTLIRIFGSKENILAALVKYVLEEQFATTAKLLQNKTTDKILFYATETVLQLHIVESSEHLRELYAMAYSLPNTTEIIQETITDKLEYIFKEHLPYLEKKDFYMLEIASGGVMRGFMTVPCNMWFTMDEKIKAFLETTFSIYKVPDEKVKEAIEFVSLFDFKQSVEKIIQDMLEKVAEKA
jgi:AcrR family transcriptional regulator